MLNYIWAFMIIIGIIYGSLTGHMAELSNAALDSAREAVTLCITMLGVMAHADRPKSGHYRIHDEKAPPVSFVSVSAPAL